MKLPQASMNVLWRMVLLLFYLLFVTTQGSHQLVHVISVDNPTHEQEYRCVTEPEVEATEYSWYKQGWAGLPEGVKAEGDRLHFIKFTTDLNGVYICEVTNEKGSAAASLYLQQMEPKSEL
ncbi:nectin-4-like [Neoarius graeffei]|uniref:nectin-4-like n=1 Tax=Neoarius graeffei TaxID=443677 RepID=UPI00298CD00A|nr:nectin-4-like [Neoarius graeffei]